MENEKNMVLFKGLFLLYIFMAAASTLKKNSWYLENTALAFLLAVIAFSIYANTLTNGYVLDDFSAIVKNKIVTQGISAIPEIFSTPYLRGFTINPNDLYRPLPLAMFAAEYQLFSGTPFISHLMNVIFFAACVALLFLFLDTLFQKKKTQVAFITALLFALHPIHTEVVANIKSRDELLCFFFAFFSLNLFAGYCRTGRALQLIGASLCYFLSLLAKETSITFLFVFPLVFFLFSSENKKRSVHITVCAATVAAIYLFIRFSVLNAHHAASDILKYSIADNYLAAAPSVSARLSTAILILGYYLKLLFVPYPLSCDYSFNTIPFVSFSNAGVLISLMIYIILIAVAIYRLVRFPKDPFAFAILFFLVTLALFSNVFFLIGAAMAERFLFFPSVGFCLLLSLVIEKCAYTNPVLLNRKALAIIIPLSLFYSVVTIARNRDWQDGITLYKNDIKHKPDSFRLYFYLGSALLTGSAEETNASTKNKMITEGIDHLKKSLSIYPDFAIPYSEIGHAYTTISQYDSAERYNLLAMTLNPNDTFTINNQAAVYFKKGDYRRSLELCKKNIALDPGSARTYRNMGSCYLKSGVYDSAIIVLKQADLLEPGFAGTYRYLSFAYRQIGNNDSSAKYEALAGKK